VLNEIRIKTPEIWERHHKKVLQSIADFEKLGFCMSWGDLRRDVHAVGVPLRLMSTGDIVVFNCAMQAFLVKPAQIRNDIGPKLAAMVREVAEPGDFVVCLGAGSITNWAQALPAELGK